MKNESAKKIIILLLIVLLAVALALLVFRQQKMADSEVIAEAGKTVTAQDERTEIIYAGKGYPLRHSLQSILLIGTDSIEGKEGPKPGDGYYYNLNLADFLVLLVFDNDAGTVTPIEINRDTIAEVPWISLNNQKGGYETQQICYAFTYGSGAEDSCANTAEAVSHLLLDVPIDGYLAFSMDAVPIINDLIGGVTVTLPENIPALGEEYTKGTPITLRGSAALRFVRYRDTQLTDSNFGRMARQRLYLQAFLPQAADKLRSNDNLVAEAVEKLGSYLVSRLTANELSQIAERLCEYEILPALSYGGSYVQGDYAEFYPEEKDLWSCVKTAFCSP